MDREVGYCQGSAFIVGLLLMQVCTSRTGLGSFGRALRWVSTSPIPKLEVVPAHPIPSHIAPLSRWQDAEEGVCVLLCPQMPEEEAFCVFVRLMQEYRLRELFKPSMAELGLCIYQFEYMLQVSAARGSPKCCSSPWGRGPGEG